MDNKRLIEWKSTETRIKDRDILAGDLNAHFEAWRTEDGNDARGEELLTRANEQSYNIANDKRLGPTFVTVSGSSSIDVTLSRGTDVLD